MYYIGMVVCTGLRSVPGVSVNITSITIMTLFVLCGARVSYSSDRRVSRLTLPHSCVSTALIVCCLRSLSFSPPTTLTTMLRLFILHTVYNHHCMHLTLHLVPIDRVIIIDISSNDFGVM